MISRDDVQKLADLSLIAIDESELDTVASEIDAILGYVSEVSKLAGEEQEPVVPALNTVLRDDVNPHESGTFTDAILDQAPDRKGNHVRVKKIL
jgi:aspartyl-tRNA(Asn)/glutamyl-tRNA(Gln) amidotransferase subunit C